MEIITELVGNVKEDRITINNAISTIRKSMADYKAERKSDWKSFKSKFNDDMDKIQESLKKMTPKNKKHHKHEAPFQTNKTM